MLDRRCYASRMSDPALQSRETRESVFLSAVVTGFGGGEPTRHRVRNLSAQGACIDHAASLRKGQTVLIDVGVVQELGATVRWVEGDLAGLKFAHPIPPVSAKTRPKPDHVRQGWASITAG